jgi:dihydrolipoamide dehydrogenase
MMAETSFDLIVVGSGPGGYVAAIRAAQLGMKAAVVERAELGGICLNWGCIPTKALLRSAEVYRTFQHAKDYGLSAEKIGFDNAAVVKRSRAVSKQLNQGVTHLLKKNKVTTLLGSGTLKGGGKVEVTDKDGKTSGYSAKHIVLATGARPRVLPGLEPDKKLIWTYFEAMVPEKMPKSLLVMGSGAIGIEFASFFRTMGAEVTVVEILPQILPVEDEEIAGHARKQLEKQGLKILTSTKVAKLEDLGLENTKVKTERGLIVTHGLGKTDEPGVYAIGDVAGPPMLAHKASHEGVLCVEAIAGQHPHEMDKLKIPGCTYCHPQVASVGLTEKKAKEAGHEVKVGRFPFIGNGKAIALGEAEGLVKTVFDAKTGQLLGAHMVGAEVTELIQGYVVAMNLETTEEDLMQTVFPHPTLSEMMHESVLSAYGRAIHF